MHGFENQTYESLRILKSRKTPFIIAANKIDRIEGWHPKPGIPFLQTYSEQQLLVQEDLDNRLYSMMGTLSREGINSERFDRVRDFTRNVAIVPVSAKTGEGIGELLAVLIGLTQQYMQDKLTVTKGRALGTVLEVREEVGLGHTLNAIIYDGVLKAEDTIVIGGKNGPISTKIRALLMPQPLDEIRDPKKRFTAIDEVPAAAGIKIAAPNIEDALPGSPLYALDDDFTENRAFAEINREMESVKVQTDKTGIIVKTDTLGSLEALVESLRQRDIPIRLADIGDISRRDIMESASVRYEEPLYGAILAFNVKLLPDAEIEAEEQRVKVFRNDIIYNLMEDYIKWMEGEREAKARKEFETLVHPAKILILDGYIFRRAKPAIFGVRVEAGVLIPNVNMVNRENAGLGRLTQIQDQGAAVGRSEEGKEVAVSMPAPIVGRHIKERDVLYVDVPEKDARALRQKFAGRLTENANKALAELIEIKRKKDPLWAI
jgi:translation initiation factor 5B